MDCQKKATWRYLSLLAQPRSYVIDYTDFSRLRLHLYFTIKSR